MKSSTHRVFQFFCSHPSQSFTDRGIYGKHRNRIVSWGVCTRCGARLEHIETYSSPEEASATFEKMWPSRHRDFDEEVEP